MESMKIKSVLQSKYEALHFGLRIMGIWRDIAILMHPITQASIMHVCIASHQTLGKCARSTAAFLYVG
jgi:hypothetical protein